ncbi:uncharacterized protein V6R79_015252 [Siganus canaliculatus]
MKFAALALALLLAVGSQAASLQSDAPSQLDHVRGAARAFLQQVRDSGKNIIRAFDGPQHEEARIQASNNLDVAVNWLLEKQTEAAPYTDAVVAQIVEATAGLRETYEKEADALKVDLEAKFGHFKSVVERHIDQYREKLGPAVAEYRAKNAENMAALKVRLEPIVAELRQIVPANWQETREAILPMVESIKSSVENNAAAAQAAIGPYIQEYREQLGSSAGLSEEKKAQIREKFTEIVALFQSN